MTTKQSSTSGHAGSERARSSRRARHQHGVSNSKLAIRAVPLVGGRVFSSVVRSSSTVLLVRWSRSAVPEGIRPRQADHTSVHAVTVVRLLMSSLTMVLALAHDPGGDPPAPADLVVLATCWFGRHVRRRAGVTSSRVLPQGLCTSAPTCSAPTFFVADGPCTAPTSRSDSLRFCCSGVVPSRAGSPPGEVGGESRSPASTALLDGVWILIFTRSI